MTLGARVVYYYMSLGLGLCRYGHIFLGAVNGLKGLVNAVGDFMPSGPQRRILVDAVEWCSTWCRKSGAQQHDNLRHTSVGDNIAAG